MNRDYVRVQATAAGLINAIVNPAIDWLTARHKGPQPIWGVEGLVVNFVITSLILSTLVGAFAAWGVRREVRAGRFSARRPPRRGWLVGLAFGVAAAVLAILVCGLAHAVGVTTLPLAGLMAIKAGYAGLLGFLVARSVILRYL